MKKLVFSLALVAGLAFAASNAQAQNNANNKKKQEPTSNVSSRFIDNDGDGICDNYDGNSPGQGLGLGNKYGKGRGICKGMGCWGNGQGRGGNKNFVDANNNGICDNLENGTGRQRLRDGSGGGNGSKN